MSIVTKPTLSSGGSRGATRVLNNLLWIIIGLLGLTGLNGWAASGFTHFPNPIMEIFGPVFFPAPIPPQGYQPVTPAQMQQDASTDRHQLIGEKVAVYGELLPWQDSKNGDITKTPMDMKILGIQTRPGTITLSRYADPTEHPEMSVKPITVVVQIPESWKKEHAGIQGQWVQAWGVVVP